MMTDWDATLFEQKAQECLEGAPLDKLAFRFVDQDDRVTNDMLNLSNNLVAESGIQILSFQSWVRLESLNATVIKRMVAKTSNLQELYIQMMKDLSDSGKESLADIACQALQTSSCLRNVFLRDMKWNGPTTTRLLNALCASPSLETFLMVNLYRSDLSEDDSIIALGKFLATATDLNQCDIGRAEGRQINI